MQHVKAVLNDTRNPPTEKLPLNGTWKFVYALEVAGMLTLQKKKMHRSVKGQGRHLIAGKHEELSLVIASARFVSMHASMSESKRVAVCWRACLQLITLAA